MESRQTTKSVMTRLMGLDQVPKQLESIHEPQRKVISENYLRRVASIGIGKKRSFHDHHSVRKSSKRNGDEFRLKASSGSLQGILANKRNDDVHRKSRRRTEFGYLEPFQKLENCVVADNRRIGSLKPNHSFSSPSSHSGFNKCQELSDPVDWRVEVELKERNILGCDERSTRRCISREIKALSPEKLLGSEAKEPLSERCSRPRNSEEVGTLDVLFAKPGHVSRPRNHKHGNGNRGLKDLDPRKLSKQQAKYEAFRSKWNLQSDKSLNWARLNLRKHKFETSKSLPCLSSEACHPYSGTWESNDDMNTLISTDNSVSVVGGLVMDVETEVALSPPEKSKNKNLKDDDDDCSSRATDGSVQQEASLGFLEESLALSLCNRMELDSQMILEETYQQSPISVLEQPFSEEATYELGTQLENIESEASETYSEGPGMAVSSDDESEQELSHGSIKQNEVRAKICGVEESQNFSYLVEVITNASLHGKSLADFSTWHSLDRPISLSVFETLEKKYSDKISWTRSERMLLFDRVNEGLVEILLHCIGVPTWQKSVSRRFSTVRSDEEVSEEDLWKLLVSQEKECRKSSGENVVGSEFGKLELGDEIIAIGGEIERLLFDELLAEIFVLA